MKERMPIQESIPGVLTSREIIQDHYREIGRRGGSRTSPAKQRASRDNGQWATECRLFKMATQRMTKARKDVAAKRIRVVEYEEEFKRFTVAYDRYTAAVNKRIGITPRT